MMENKSMYLANLNITFGVNDEPLLKWLDEFVLPALTSGIKREIKSKNKKEPTRVLFKDVDVEEIENGELVLKGVIIKDTVLDIYNQLDEKEELVDDEQHPKSAPYSTFMIFLKNHRMVLVRRQAGSPDLRLFSSTLSEILKKYRKQENKRRKEENIPYLPSPIVWLKGIKTDTTIKEVLNEVSRIKNVTLILKPRNNENGGLDDLVDGLDNQILKIVCSKQLKLSINSPNSIEGVEKIIKEASPILETQLEVEYSDFDEEGNKQKSTARIKDNEIAQRIEIGIKGELKKAFREVYEHCKNIESLNVKTDNIVSYEKYLQKKREKDARKKE
nr:MAG TPA: protein of unknown function (DUF4747) [Caudoviricetes sp.]